MFSKNICEYFKIKWSFSLREIFKEVRKRNVFNVNRNYIKICFILIYKAVIICENICVYICIIIFMCFDIC